MLSQHLYFSPSPKSYLSFMLLHTFSLKYNYVDTPNKCVLYYDPTVECHTQEYTIFSSIAYCGLIIFIICPTILQPTRPLRRCVSHCEFQRSMFCTFVESFQGQYKDGTNGTRDLRTVSASFLILRIVILFLFVNHHRSISRTLELEGVLLACATCIHAITRPYKLNNTLHAEIISRHRLLTRKLKLSA